MSNIHDKLVAIQSEINAPKNLYNNFGKYKYRNAESILEAVKPLLKKHGLVIGLSDEIVMIGDRYYIKSTATISGAESATKAVAYAREEETKKGMDGSQITGSASSYARKFALSGLFAIDDGVDADSREHPEEKKKEVKDLTQTQYNASIIQIERAEPEHLDVLETKLMKTYDRNGKLFKKVQTAIEERRKALKK